MRSTASLCNKTLFFRNVRRFAPLWGVFLGLLVLNLPTVSFTDTSDWTGRLVFSGIRVSVLFQCFVYALLCAALPLHYLHKTNTAYMMHAFPFSRATLYCTTVLSGLCFAFFPYLIYTLLSTLCMLSAPAAIPYLWQLFAYELLCFLCFYGLAVFCMLFSGRTVIAVLSYLALNFIGWLLPALALGVLSRSCFGWHPDSSVFRYLSPLATLSSDSVLAIFDHTRPVGTLLVAGVYALVGAALLALSWLLYRKRKLERAGDAVVFRWAERAFLILFTAFITLALGMVLSAGFLWNDSARTAVYLIPGFLVAAFVGYLGAQMMLQRTVRVFQRRRWRGYALCAGIVTLLLLGIRFDLLGIQRYVPPQEQLMSAEVSLSPIYAFGGDEMEADSCQVTLRDTEDLDRVLRWHRSSLEAWQENYVANRRTTLYVVYHLRSGRTVKRDFALTEQELKNLKTVCASPSVAVPFYEEQLPEDLGYLNVVLWHDGTRYPCTAPFRLRDAMLQDAEEGHLAAPLYLDYYRSGEQYELEIGSVYYPLTEQAEHTLALFLKTG